MPRGYRSHITTIAGLAIVAVAIFLLVYDLSAVDSAYRHSAADTSVKYQSDANAYIKERCLSPAGLREEDCAAKAYEAAREGQRKEQDLAAQNVTAWWTKIMGIAAIIGMALSAVGVWLVKTTFDETRQANFLSKAQQRGRIELSFRGGVGGDTGNLVIAIEGRNIGHSAATNCRISVQYGREIPKNYSTEEMGLTSRIIAGQSSANLASFSDVEYLADGYFLFGVVTYNCIFGDFHETYFCVQIIPARSIPDHSNSSLITAIPCKPANWPNDT